MLSKEDLLESLGCEVRCVDQEEPNYGHSLMTFNTMQSYYADYLQCIRTRAIAFAAMRQETYAEIDDLIFTPDYPAEFNTYGGSIPFEQYKIAWTIHLG